MVIYVCIVLLPCTRLDQARLLLETGANASPVASPPPKGCMYCIRSRLQSPQEEGRKEGRVGAGRKGDKVDVEWESSYITTPSIIERRKASTSSEVAKVAPRVRFRRHTHHKEYSANNSDRVWYGNNSSDGGRWRNATGDIRTGETQTETNRGDGSIDRSTARRQ